MSAAEDRYTAAREALLAQALDLGEFTFDDLLNTKIAGRVLVGRQITLWCENGVVTKLSGKPATYRVRGYEAGQAKDRREAGSLRGNLWATLRRLKTCTPTDLAIHATTSAIPAAAEDAQAFLGQLLRADYVRCDRTARPGVREAVYRLVQNTGPRPPVLRRTTVMIDPNLNKVTYIAGGAL